MMRHRDLTLTIALCLSLALHALVCVGAAEIYVRGARVSLPALARERVAEAIYVEAIPPQDLKLRLGEPNATGTAIDASPGNLPLQAPEGFQDQPFLSRDPEGPGLVDEPAVESRMPPQSTPAEESTARFGIAPPPLTMQALQNSPPPPSAPPMSSADPAPMAESEIDPVSTAITMDFRRGSTESRSGRKHRITHPRLNVASKADLYALRAGRLVLQIRLDDSGQVNHVKILKSSGSTALDQTCKVAAYEWWFEPLRDASGKLIANEFPFVIVF